MSHANRRPDGPVKESQLAELVACEQELAALLADAEARARQMVEEARAAAAAAAAELEASLEDEAERLRVLIREDTQRRVRELEAGARAEAARFDQVPAEELDRLVELGYRRLLSAEAEP